VAIESGFKLVAMFIAPALIFFICAGAVLISKYILAMLQAKSEEVDHEL